MGTCWFDRQLNPLFDPEEGASDQLLGCSAWQEDHGDWMRISSVVDSGACAPVAPPSAAPGHRVRPSAGSRAGKSYNSASGHPLYNLGELPLRACTDNGLDTDVLFQLADVSCPLVSVSHICDHGNRVVFGRSGGVIYNLTTGMEVPFERRGGVYILGLWVRRGSDEAEEENRRHLEKVRAETKRRSTGVSGFMRP